MVLFVVLVVLVSLVLLVWSRFHFPAGYAVFLAHPGSEIDELTTLRTKGPVRIVFPDDFVMTAGTFYLGGHGRPR
jgi:hypothetical protein